MHARPVPGQMATCAGELLEEALRLRAGADEAVHLAVVAAGAAGRRCGGDRMGHALLHFRAPTDLEAARELAGGWRRVEADDLGPYGGLRKEARGVRVLWERQRATVTELRQAGGGERRPNLAMWRCAVCHFYAPRSSDEARQLLRDWRLLLAGDDPG